MLDDPAFLPLLSINLLGIAGIVVWHLQGRNRPKARLIFQILFFLAMTAVLRFGGVLPYRVAETYTNNVPALLAASARVLWWIHLAWSLIGVVRIIVLDRRPTQARLLQDLMVAVVYIGISLSILAFVFGAPIGALVATSGVVAVVFGLALQNTLSDVFSGIALTLGRPFVIGDWIQLADGTEGRVVENNWRSTQLLTGAHNIVVLPNSVLAKVGLTNLTRPDETHLISLTVRISSSHEPGFVEGVMRSVFEPCASIVRQAPAIVALKSIDAAAIELELQFRVADPSHRIPARNELIDSLYRRCRESGVSLAMPLQSYRYTLPLEGKDANEKSR
ncbi:mechanosensitive ion channel family protein [Brucella sp. NBRC 12950]|uniref:mechanosensitive ion channel family protein n=1 Tax=Brucella sp. NBRC 12950 TaxID=2994518 RepID=UPI0024A5AB4C|nr:mechanosensitive ion channel family protein [Brucella sp. NBRC 12950]GLU29063.1 membrane protein [Brucella sp. NBRC 12950]